MRKKLFFTFLIFLLLCAACTQPKGGASSGKEGSYTLYFLSNERGELTGETATLSEDRSEVESLLSQLLAGPQTLNLNSPIPRGTRLRGWNLAEGLVTVDLSEIYGGLSEVTLSQADGCIVLTLCQLESVDRVYITVEGHARPFRDKVYSAVDFLLTSGETPAGETDLTLWFLGESGLVREEQTVRLAAGDRLEVAALQALLAGPQSDELLPICPEGTRLLSVEQKGERFTVDLSAQWLEGEEEPQRLYAILNTLTELEPEAQMTLLVEGQRLTQFAALDLTKPLTAGSIETE